MFNSHWQEHGYLIIYVTSRPDFQKNQVMLWMSEHNFPFGLVSFCGSLSTVDIQRHKAEYLRNLTTNVSNTGSPLAYLNWYRIAADAIPPPPPNNFQKASK